MIPSWARVGAKVVMIAPFASSDFRGIPNRPHVGGIYTIRAVNVRPLMVGLLLAEIVNDPTETMVGFVDRDFGAVRFRPLITQQDDIETHFRALLDAPLSVEA